MTPTAQSLTGIDAGTVRTAVDWAVGRLPALVSVPLPDVTDRIPGYSRLTAGLARQVDSMILTEVSRRGHTIVNGEVR